MTREEALAVLGAQSGDEAPALRSAYLRALKAHKPDVDPDGFRRVRAAYEALTSHDAAARRANRVVRAETTNPAPSGPGRTEPEEPDPSADVVEVARPNHAPAHHSSTRTPGPFDALGSTDPFVALDAAVRAARDGFTGPAELALRAAYGLDGAARLEHALALARATHEVLASLLWWGRDPRKLAHEYAAFLAQAPPGLFARNGHMLFTWQALREVTWDFTARPPTWLARATTEAVMHQDMRRLARAVGWSSRPRQWEAWRFLAAAPTLGRFIPQPSSGSMFPFALLILGIFGILIVFTFANAIRTHRPPDIEAPAPPPTPEAPAAIRFPVGVGTAPHPLRGRDGSGSTAIRLEAVGIDQELASSRDRSLRRHAMRLALALEEGCEGSRAEVAEARRYASLRAIPLETTRAIAELDQLIERGCEDWSAVSTSGTAPGDTPRSGVRP